MKVERRSYPLDMLSVSEGEYDVRIMTHGHTVLVVIDTKERNIMRETMSLAGFVELLMKGKT